MQMALSGLGAMREVEVVDHALEEEDVLLLVGSPQEVDGGLLDGDGHPGLTLGLASLLKGLLRLGPCNIT